MQELNSQVACCNALNCCDIPEICKSLRLQSACLPRLLLLLLLVVRRVLLALYGRMTDGC